MAEEHGERLARLEVESRQTRETLDRMARTLEKLAENEWNYRQAQADIARLDNAIDAYDSDFELMGERIKKLDNEQTRQKHYMESRWWVLVVVAAIGSTVGGWLMQVAIKALF